MNFLSFIISLLLIFSFSLFVSVEKSASGRKAKQSFLGHMAINRKVEAKSVTERFKKIPGKVTELSDKEKNTSSSVKPKKEPNFGASCCKLNLFFLIEEGKEKHLELYNLTLNLLEKFYGGSLLYTKNLSKEFLDHFLKSAKLSLQNKNRDLEKIDLKNEHQMLYYRMLKGSKNQTDLPSFLDVFCLEEKERKICLFHAHPMLLEALFTDKVSDPLYEKIHEDPAPILTEELIESICMDHHTFLPKQSPLFQFLQMGKVHHEKETKLSLSIEDKDTKLTLKKNIPI